MHACDTEPKKMANPCQKRQTAVLKDSVRKRLLAYTTAGAGLLAASTADASNEYVPINQPIDYNLSIDIQGSVFHFETGWFIRFTSSHWYHVRSEGGFARANFSQSKGAGVERRQSSVYWNAGVFSRGSPIGPAQAFVNSGVLVSLGSSGKTMGIVASAAVVTLACSFRSVRPTTAGCYSVSAFRLARLPQ